MKAIITKQLDKRSKEVVLATIETISYYLKLLHDQIDTTSHISYDYLNPSFLLTEIWTRKEFLETVYKVKIIKD